MTPSLRPNHFDSLYSTASPGDNYPPKKPLGGSPLRAIETGRGSDWDQYQVALAELGQIALSENHLPTLCHFLTQAVATTLQVSHCRIWQTLSDGIGLQTLAAFGWEEASVNHAQIEQLTMDGVAKIPGSPSLQELLEQGQTIRLRRRGGRHGALALDTFPLSTPSSAVGGVVVAIPGQETPLGLLVIYSSDRPTSTYDEEQFLHAVVNVVAAAIERKRSEALLHAQTQVLELVAGGTELTQVYDNLCRLLAQEAPGAMCSIMVLNGEPRRLYMKGRSPNVPAQFVAVVDGLEPGEAAASCGTAAFRGKPVFVTDAMTADEWLPCREVASTFNIRACWSVPFLAQDGGVLGTFAISLHVPCEPTQHHLQILRTAAHLASIATEGHQAAAKLQRQALYDPLTGLPNRNFFLQMLRQECEQVKALRRRQTTPGERWGMGMEVEKGRPLDMVAAEANAGAPGLAILFFDVDRFKLINDSFGHHVGDLYLVAIAQRLSKCLEPHHMFARLSGDEFAVMVRSVRWRDEAIAIAHSIKQALIPPLTVGSKDVFASMSVGIAALTEECQLPEDLLRHADTAMYYHKANPRKAYAIFDEAMHVQTRARLQLEMDLCRALSSLDCPETCQLRVYYQPITNLRTGRLAGFEALVRWKHPERGFIPPSEFIPVAEETSAIAHIGNWVLDQACRQLHLWQQQAPLQESLFMSVNVATCQFLQADFVDRITQALNTHNLQGQDLKLEITETALMQAVSSVQQVLGEIQALGVKLSLDDFGTGYSSLSYLHQLSIDTLKIDRSFVAAHDNSQGSIVETILMLARGLDLDVIAEGVETTEQCAWLRQLGCDFGQGYLFSRPLPPTQVQDLFFRSF